MKQRFLHYHIIWLSFLLLAIGIICFNHVLELRNEEGRRAIVSMEMVAMDEYIVPHLQGVPYYNKPPLYNWVLAGTFLLFNNASEFFLRLPGALSFLATALVLFLFAKKYVGRETALLMAGAYLTIADLLFYGSINAGEIDLFYSCLVVLQALLIFHFREKESYLSLFVLTYVLTAIGVLTKGLPSIAFQGLTLAVYFIVTKRFLKLFSWQHFLGILIFLLLTGGYFYLYSTRNEVTGYLVNLFKQASQRTANEYGFTDTVLTTLFFPVYLFRYLLPWSLFVVFLFIKAVRKSLFRNRFIAFCTIFILANIPLYWTAPELRIRYIYMFFPFFAAILVYAAREAFGSGYRPGTWVSKFILGTIMLAGAGCFVLLFLPFEKHLASVACLGLAGASLLFLGIWAWSKTTGTQVAWVLVLALAIGRIGYDVAGLPYTQKKLRFRDITNDMLNLCDNCDIHLTGGPMTLMPDISLMGKTFFRDTLYIPQEIPYQVPYYFTLKTGKILTFEEETERGMHYITYESKTVRRDTVLAKYPRVFGDGTLIFFQERN